MMKAGRSGSLERMLLDAMTVKGVKSIRLVPVSVAPVGPFAAFEGVPVTGTAPLTVVFTDKSTGTGPLTYTWDFNNDGITDNTTQSPSYTYGTAGVYTVNLTVTNSVGSDSECKDRIYYRKLGTDR